MADKLTRDQRELQAIETRIAMAIATVFGTVNRAESERLYRLRRKTGLRYDAVNGAWRPWRESE